MAEKQKGKHLEEEEEIDSGPRPPSGGYEDSLFTDTPPDSLTCPVCLLVLKEPHLLSCCGAHICEVCIEHIKKQSKPCPCCREEEYTTLLNKRMRGNVYSLIVRCDISECVWTGELGELQRHKTDSCQYTVVPCRYGCGASYPRNIVATHERDKCPKCPIENRVEGLSVRMDIELAALEKKYTAEIASLKEIIRTQSTVVESLKLDIQGLHQELQSVKKETAVKDGIKETVSTKETSTDIKTTKESDKKTSKPVINVNPPPSPLPAAHCSPQWTTPTNTEDMMVPPCVMIMKQYSQHKKARDVWYSPPFYSSKTGYRFCLAVHANGDNTGKDTHLSLYVVLMKGVNDAVLKWPFKGEFVIQLMNWREDANHVSSVIKFDEYTPKEWSRRLYEEERAINGRGKHRFLVHSSFLYNAVKNTEFLSEDRLCLKVLKVNI